MLPPVCLPAEVLHVGMAIAPPLLGRATAQFFSNISLRKTYYLTKLKILISSHGFESRTGDVEYFNSIAGSSSGLGRETIKVSRCPKATTAFLISLAGCSSELHALAYLT
jgi:hypothetical protein